MSRNSNFQMHYPDKLSDIPPAWNCQWQEMKSSLIYVISESPFETDGRIMSSFQMKCTTRSTCQMKYPDKLLDFPPSFRRSVHWDPNFQMKCSDSDIPPTFTWSAQMKCTLRPKPEMRKWVHIFTWSVQISCQIYPPTFRWSAQMKCTLRPKPEMRKWVHIFRWSVQTRCQIYPPKVVKWSEQDEVHMDMRYEFIFSDEVPR